MKIELDLTRAEAHDMNYLISLGARQLRNTPGGFSRTAARALARWHEAYLEGMTNG